MNGIQRRKTQAALADLAHLHVLGLEYDAMSALPDAAQDAVLVHCPPRLPRPDAAA